MMNAKVACWLVLVSMLLTANAAEKTMTLLPTGGAWAVTNGTWVAGIGELSAGGALTVTGTPVIGLPENPSAAFRKTLFTYTSIDAASAAALSSAAFDPSVTLPKGLKAHVNVNATSCVLTISADGTIMIFR